MSFSLNDIISRSEKRSRGQLVIEKEPHLTPASEIGLNVITVEEQQRMAAAVSQPMPKEKKAISQPYRSSQVKTRLSEEEKKYFDKRVQISGLSQGDFMRQILLHESVEIHSVTAMDAEALELLSGIASELGRIGGMIRGTVIHNKGEFGILTPQEKVNLECTIRELNQLKADIHKVVQSIYGDH